MLPLLSLQIDRILKHSGLLEERPEGSAPGVRPPPGIDNEYAASHEAGVTAGQGYEPNLEYTYVDLATFETEF